MPPDDLTPAVLAERIRHLDALHKAHELELHDLRVELDARLRQSYLTSAEMRNVFVTRDEIAAAQTRRREWPVVLASVIVAGCSLASLIVVIAGAH